VKLYAEKAGYDPADYSGHSLRSGFLTSAATRGASIFKLIEVSRHKSVDTLRGYIRKVEIFENHAAEDLLSMCSGEHHGITGYNADSSSLSCRLASSIMRSATSRE
jgi:hypothetical protein